MTEPPAAKNCRRCRKRPPAPGSGWCVRCLDAEDAARERATPRTYLTDAQRRGAAGRAVLFDLEDWIYQHYADGVGPWVLGRDLGLPVDVVTVLIQGASSRDTPSRRGRGTRATRRTRPLASRTTSPTGSAQRASIALDEGVHRARNGNEQRARTCPICLVVFEPARDDQRCCSARCRRVKHRLDHDDPTVEATIVFLRNPPPCAGCGEPLIGKSVTSKYHGDTCRKRDRRRSAEAASRVTPA